MAASTARSIGPADGDGGGGSGRPAVHSWSVCVFRCILSFALLDELYRWQTCSIEQHLDFSGKHSALLQLVCEDILIYPPLSIARYSIIQLTELEQCRVNEFTQSSKLHNRILGFISRESKL